MAILDIKSSNPAFSHIVRKNPQTVIDTGKAFHKELRKGRVYGWFPSNNVQAFRLWFKDAVNQSSFTQGATEEFEYLDKTRYSSAYLPVQMLDTLLRSAFKDRHELDTDEFQAECSFATEFLRPRIAERMIQIFGESSEFKPFEGLRFYGEVTIRGKSVYEVLNKVICFSIVQAVFDKKLYIPMDINVLEKYVKALNAADAPYYVRYLFQSFCCASPERFNHIKDDLEVNGKYLMHFGNTQNHRQRAILPLFQGGMGAIDIGAGECRYTFPLSKEYEHVVSIEQDLELHEWAKRKAGHKKIENVTFLNEQVTPEYIRDHLANSVNSMCEHVKCVDVLMTEVMEHNEKEVAFNILKELLKLNARQVVVTVPNYDFNKHYFMDEGEFRHDDHKWEPGFEEWCDEMTTLAAEFGWDVETKGVGDVVDDSQPTIITIFSNKD